MDAVRQTPSSEPTAKLVADGASLHLTFQGAWTQSRGGPPLSGVLPETAPAGSKTLCLAADQLEAWDSVLLGQLYHACGWARQQGLAVDAAALPEGLRKLLALSLAVPARALDKAAGSAPGPLVRLGAQAQRQLDGLAGFLSFTGEFVQALYRLVRRQARFRWSDFALAFQACGPGALPIVTTISLLVGTILAFLGAIQLKMFGAQIFIADLVALGMAREMGSLMTGIIMAGRTGASYAAQIGTMQVNEEVDALRTLGFDPMEFLVLPRALALFVAMPLLSLYATFVGMLGGALVGVLLMDLTAVQFWNQVKGVLGLDDLVSGLIKGALYGVLVAMSGCMYGIRCGRSASAVGEAVTRAVVSGIVYIIIADSVVSILYTLIGF